MFKKKSKKQKNVNEIFEAFKSIKRVDILSKKKLEKEQKFLIEQKEKAAALGQEELFNKISTLLAANKKELVLLENGFNQVVSLEKIKKLNRIGGRNLLLNDLKDFPREIPNDVACIILKAKNFFSGFYILYTDYTVETAEKVDKKNIERDPVVFGYITIKDEISPRLYFIADWIDEYCDLTFDLVVNAIEG